MKTKDKLLLLFMMMFMCASCSKTETGVITKKEGYRICTRSLGDTTMSCDIDFTLVNIREDPMRGIFAGCIMDELYTYKALAINDTITYKKARNCDYVIVNNWNQIRRINNMKPHEFMLNRFNIR